MENEKMTPIEVAQAFVERINAHDPEGLSHLMTEDHTFIDGGGDRHRGRERMTKGWKDYFGMVPDFWIKIDKIFHQKNCVALFGQSGGTYAPDGKLDPRNRWEAHAAWQVIIQDDKVLTWQVYVDSEQLRQIIERNVEEEPKK
jgi:hypothetical protein